VAARGDVDGIDAVVKPPFRAASRRPLIAVTRPGAGAECRIRICTGYQHPRGSALGQRFGLFGDQVKAGRPAPL